LTYANDVIEFYGHAKVLATHNSTFEITKESHLSFKGDCIIGVKSDKSCVDLDSSLKELLKQDNSIIHLTLEVEGEICEVFAKGNIKFSLQDVKDLVIRRSDYSCPRTIAGKSSHAAKDISRKMINLLKSSNTKGYLKIEAYTNKMYANTF
jgi:hypothetical protein